MNFEELVTVDTGESFVGSEDQDLQFEEFLGNEVV